MPHFSNHMSYQQIADALHHAHLESKKLSSSEWQCLSHSLENPLTRKLLELHPLPSTSQEVITDTRAQIIPREPQREAREPQRGHHAVDNGVHSVSYGGVRAKTAAYLNETYPPAQSADWMERLSKLVGDAIKTNTEVQEALKNAETSRYHERENERANIQQKARARNQTADLYTLPPETPEVSLTVIQEDFINYLNYLESLHISQSLHVPERPYAWDVLQSLMQWYESRNTAEQKQDALVSLIIALDDARAAYHTQHFKHITGTDYTCQKGLEERLLDHHAYLLPLEVQAPTTPVEQTLHALTEPFLSHAAALEGCRATFSAELYRMYCEVAGYQIVKPEPIEIYALIEDIQKNDTELEEQYLSSLETSSPLSERMKDYHRNQFRSLLGSMRQKSVLASVKTTPALKFLQDQSLVRITSHQPEETLQQVGSEKTEAEIFNEMLRRYPCFLGAAHLKLILTLHNLYGVFDGDFETYATFATLKKVAESGHIPDSTVAIDAAPIREAYSQYLSSQEVPFYDFYPTTSHDRSNLSTRLLGHLYEWPCSEEVLLEWLQKNSYFYSGHAPKFAVFSSKTGYTNALRVLLSPPYSVSPNYECPEERETLLMLATKAENFASVEKLITAGAPLNHSNRFGETPLMQIARNRDRDIGILQAMIRAGADVNSVSQNEDTALLFAIMSGNIDSVQALIHAGVNVNYVSTLAALRSSKTPLIVAVQNKNIEMMKALIAAHANVNYVDSNGNTPLMQAVSSGTEEMVDLLIDAGANINFAEKEGVTALLIAARTGKVAIMQALIRAGAAVNHASLRGNTALIQAARDGHTAIVQSLLDTKKINLNHATLPGETALIAAIKNGHTDVVKALLAAGANINQSDRLKKSPLMLALEKKNIDIEIVRTLILFGARMEGVQNLPHNAPDLKKSYEKTIVLIQEAIHNHDHQGVVQLMRDNPFLGNLYIPEIKSSALMLALQRGCLDIVEDLMLGAVSPYHIKEALIYAIQHPTAHNAIPFLAQKHIVEMMIREKLPIIAMAAEHHCLNAIRIFLEAGADVNQPDEEGYTAHMYASQQGDSVLSALLQTSATLTNDGQNMSGQQELATPSHHRSSLFSTGNRERNTQKNSSNPS